MPTSSRAALLELPVERTAALCDALSRTHDFAGVMQILEGARRELLGEGLLTVNLRTDRLPGRSAMKAREDDVELQRVWSSDVDAYPLAGRKRKSWTSWTLQLLGRGEVFVGEGAAAIEEAFGDHALIASLGLQSVVNVPLLDPHGACFATFNVLTPQARWTPRDVVSIRLLALLATPAVALEAVRLS